MQQKEEELQKGGRESFPVKIIETAGKTLEQTLVDTDPFNWNECADKKCVVSNNTNVNNNKTNCTKLPSNLPSLPQGWKRRVNGYQLL